MDLTLTRYKVADNGAYSRMSRDDTGAQVAVTCEHAYDGVPKLPCGTFTCVRGMHRLGGADHDFETFEITGVPGHTGLLFHPGNFPDDSHGCVLTGQSECAGMITSSRVTFEAFIALQVGVNTFKLTVTGSP